MEILVAYNNGSQQTVWQYGRAMNIFSVFLFATPLRFRQTNNAEQQNKQCAFDSLLSSGTGQTEHRIPPHRQCFNVVGKPNQTVHYGTNERLTHRKDE